MAQKQIDEEKAKNTTGAKIQRTTTTLKEKTLSIFKKNDKEKEAPKEEKKVERNSDTSEE